MFWRKIYLSRSGKHYNCSANASSIITSVNAILPIIHYTAKALVSSATDVPVFYNEASCTLGI